MHSSKLRRWVASDATAGYMYWCQGCECHHSVRTEGQSRPLWGFNDNLDAPTFTPSVLVRTGRAVNPAFQPEPGDPPEICHTFITDGMVQFLSDCTHALAGQTLPLPDLPQPGD
jgi:hypothetical protein